MKVLIILSLLTASLVIQTSCSTKKKAVSDEKVENNIQNNQSSLDKSDTLFASLERGVCFGKCPAFKVEIYNSGYAVYKGKSNTDKIGTYTARLSKDQLNLITAKAKEINFMSLENEYDNKGVTDLPNHTTSVVINGVRKTVRRRVDYPQSIVTMENQIDAIVSEVIWTKSSN